MTMHYSDPKRATDPHSLPDLEVWQDDEATCLNLTCDWSGPACMADDGCPDCRRNTIQVEPSGWWYWSCLPGCLPDGDPMGPFDTEEEALEDARSGPSKRPGPKRPSATVTMTPASSRSRWPSSGAACGAAGSEPAQAARAALGPLMEVPEP